MEQEIEKALKGIENAGKAALKVLAKFAGNDLSHTGLTEQPLERIGEIVYALKHTKVEAAERARYEGLTDEQIAEAQAVQRAAELAELQQEMQARLAGYQEPPASVEAEPADEEDESQFDAGDDNDPDKQLAE